MQCLPESLGPHEFPSDHEARHFRDLDVLRAEYEPVSREHVTYLPSVTETYLGKYLLQTDTIDYRKVRDVFQLIMNFQQINLTGGYEGKLVT